MGFDHVKLEKGMYRESGKTFTQVLESLDPSENYKGTALEGTDAFQRQLKRFDIHAKGAYSDPVEKFFRTMDSSVLFPEYIARAVKQGMEENNVLPKITATHDDHRCDGLPKRLFGSLRAGQDAHARYPRARAFRQPRSRRRQTLSSSTSAAECWWRPMRQFASRSWTCFPSRCARSARTSRQCI